MVRLELTVVSQQNQLRFKSMLNKFISPRNICVLISGVILLPMLPIWQFLFRLIAYFHYFTFTTSNFSYGRKFFKYFVVISFGLYLLYNSFDFALSPLSFGFDSLTNVYGFGPANPSIFLLLFSDLVVVYGFSREFSQRHNNHFNFVLIAQSLFFSILFPFYHVFTN